MSKHTSLSNEAVAVLRLAAGAAGLLFVAASLFADRIGLSAGSVFSRNQVLSALLGAGLLAASLLGRRFPRVYRNLAIFLLNLFIVAIVLDLGVLVVMKLGRSSELSIHARKVEEGGLDRPGAQAAQSEYTPWVVWHALPNQSGESTDSLGHRITPGSVRVSGGDGIRVFLLGGSTAWGTGVDNTETVAAYLLRSISRQTGRPVELLNLSQVGYVSTQELIELEIQLRDGNIPDVVIFLDGFNEVFTSYQSGRAGVHQNFLETAELLEGRRPQPSLASLSWHATNVSILTDLVTQSGTFEERGAEDLATFGLPGINRDSLAAEIVQISRGNYELVRRLGESCGFSSVFVWQPTIWTGAKPLALDEIGIYEGEFPGYEFVGDPAMTDLLRDCYTLYEHTMCDSLGEGSLTGVFDSASARIYTDPSGVHLNALGDSLLAESIAALVIRETASE
jgi:lysophospholipase L1-like esterase